MNHVTHACSCYSSAVGHDSAPATQNTRFYVNDVSDEVAASVPSVLPVTTAPPVTTASPVTTAPPVTTVPLVITASPVPPEGKLHQHSSHGV